MTSGGAGDGGAAGTPVPEPHPPTGDQAAPDQQPQHTAAPPPAAPLEPPAPIRRHGFWKGLAWAGVPILLLSVLSTASTDLVTLWFLAAALVPVAFIAAIVFYIRNRSDIGNGVLAAFGLGIVVLFGTCVVNLSRM